MDSTTDTPRLIELTTSTDTVQKYKHDSEEWHVVRNSHTRDKTNMLPTGEIAVADDKHSTTIDVSILHALKKYKDRVALLEKEKLELLRKLRYKDKMLISLIKAINEL